MAASDAPNSEEKKDILKGKNFYPSGYFTVPRRQLASLIRENGGNVEPKFLEKCTLLKGSSPDMQDVFFAAEFDCEVVNEDWLKEQIGHYDPPPPPPPPAPRSREVRYQRKFEGDTYLEELIAYDLSNTDYKIGSRCHRNNHPELVYVVIGLDDSAFRSHGSISATIELVDNPNGLPPETLPVLEKGLPVNISFLPSEEQKLFVERYRSREVEEGIWKHHASPEFTSEMNLLLDRFADDQVFDYVPDTDRKVRALVDPFLYVMRRSTSIFSLSSLWNGVLTTEYRVNQWNEIIQQSEFQWMPTEILFDAAGRGKIMTDINNEIKRQRYPEIFGYFEKLLEQMAPGFKKVWKTEFRVPLRPLIGTLEYTCILPVFFTSARHQFLVKITDIVLGPGEEYEDPNWNDEGVFREHVIMTGFYYSHRDPELQGGAIELEREFDSQEWNYINNGPLCKVKTEEANFTIRTQWFRETIGRWFKPKGRFGSPKTGDMMIFANCDRYGFEKIKNPLSDRTLTQRLVRISLIHPHRRLLSTVNTPSFMEQRAKMPLAEVLKIRSEMIEERTLK